MVHRDCHSTSKGETDSARKSRHGCLRRVLWNRKYCIVLGKPTATGAAEPEPGDDTSRRGTAGIGAMRSDGSHEQPNEQPNEQPTRNEPGSTGALAAALSGASTE